MTAAPDDGGQVAGRVRAYLGLGANLGDAAGTIARAIVAVDALADTQVVAVSRLYETAPVGVVDQPPFHNAVIEVAVPGGKDLETGALTCLAALKGIERDLGRRPRAHWGPREVDLDLLLFGSARIRVERPAAARSVDADVHPGKAVALLEVPHPAAAERLFVLAPLADLAPTLVPPGWGETVDAARLRRVAAEGPAAARAIARWDDVRRRWRPIRSVRGGPAQVPR